MSRTTRQNGAALIVALVLLVVVTLLGVTGLRNVTLEEKMAAATYDRSLAFQAAETALRAVEAAVQAANPSVENVFAPCSEINDSCQMVSGVLLCRQLDPQSQCTGREFNSSFTAWANANSVSEGSHTVTARYFVEGLIPPDWQRGRGFPCVVRQQTEDTLQTCKRFRIVVVASSPGASEVRLESIYQLR